MSQMWAPLERESALELQNLRPSQAQAEEEMMGRLQFWLQRREWWPACWIGNRISDARFYAWRIFTRKGRRDEL